MKLIFSVIIISQLIICQPKTIMFVGDSLIAGFQLPINQAFPAIIQEKIGTKNIQVINAGVSGDTTFTLLNRLDFTLKSTPNIVFLCIGANDGLRGKSVQTIKTNIEKIIEKLQKKQINVILAGISLPKNYSLSYINNFESAFPTVAKKYNIPYMPFLLKDVAGIPSLNLSDRIHPNKKGHEVIANHVFNFLVSENVILKPNPN
tara:strand:- start:1246 stop:1857 length:612 start_codon:yes stop_codon:yes gene_type:complete